MQSGAQDAVILDLQHNRCRHEMQHSELTEWSDWTDEQSAFIHLQGSFGFVSFGENFSGTGCYLSSF